ncbi:pyridoxal phosphate homeostasis protein [Anthonomus grandis grandis]|uniref:pyridoxal phosphate homeostasis protein n=1 Tax=Anthonomus grandis grandis TaxID=2921223 RepID=UPI0021669E3B|nr:pyridoxal phosphate homeostasis protein [Anthonomus grandis grandis]
MLRAMTEINVKQGIRRVLQQIEEAKLRRSEELRGSDVVLVAVSKIKPVELIIEAYDEGQRHFGENYVQELYDKATNALIQEKCKDIKWHFIGHLQSNKVNKVLAVPNLHLIETVDSRKRATQLNKNWPNFGGPDSKLNIMLQVNTSGEDVKNGIEPSEVNGLAEFVLKECQNLRLQGLMTIGQYGYDPAQGPNPDFLSLRKCRDDLCKALNINWKDVGLSMGMSTDFEHAIELGSTSVRVGSSIFGERPKKN